MPTKGNPVVRFRLGPEQLQLLRSRVKAEAEAAGPGPALTLSEWCRRAVLAALRPGPCRKGRARPLPKAKERK